MILWQAMAEHRAAVIEDDCIDLTRRRTQHPADHLAEETHLLCGPGQDQGAGVGHVPTFSQDHAVGDELDVAGREARESRVAFILRRATIDVLGADTRCDEFVAQVNAVANTGTETNCLPTFAVLVPAAYD